MHNKCPQNITGSTTNPETTAIEDPCQTAILSQAPPAFDCKLNCAYGGDFSGLENMTYIQPARVQSFKPLSTYRHPTEPMEAETIYRKSFYPIDACAMQNARVQPFRHSTNIQRACEKMDDKTVMAMSYMGHCGLQRPAPILPSNNLRGCGDMESETTHKHDFVPKLAGRCPPIMPRDGFPKNRDPLEQNTTFRLSFMPFDLSQNRPPKPIKPYSEYQLPNYPNDHNTIYRMSYEPVCPPPRETYPWAQKTSHIDPCASSEKDTIYKLSYIGNCMVKKAQPYLPVPYLKLDGDTSHCTIYRASYMPTKGERPKEIRPEPNLQRMCGSTEKDTIYKLSYIGNCAPRTVPILPSPSRLANKGPFASETTHKHDFVPKGGYRPAPCVPVPHKLLPQTNFEKDTVYKMSYLPNCNLERTKAYRPVGETIKSTAAMECDTIQRMSYLPVCPSKREPTPWATRGSYKPSNKPLECATIMRMSYCPPGCFVERPSSGLCRPTQQFTQTLPKAGIVN